MLFSSASHGHTCSARGHCEAWQDENRNRTCRRKFLPAGRMYLLAMRRSTPERDLNPSGAYGEKTTWICGPCSCRTGREILPDIQTNARRKRFLGTKRLWNRRNARIIPPLLWRYKRRKCGRFGPPSPMEGGPRRTRRLRQQPQFGTRDTCVPIPCESEAFTKFCRLTPSGKAGVKPSSDGGGGRLFAALLPFANSLRLSNEELSSMLPRSR